MRSLRTRWRISVGLLVIAVAVTALLWVTRSPQDEADGAGRAAVRWRGLPVATMADRAEALGVWMGDGFFVWGGTSRSGDGDGVDAGGVPRGRSMSATTLADGAVFDVVAGTWRVLGPSAPEGRIAAGGVWTGAAVVVWGGSATTDPLLYPTTALVYDPIVGRWWRSAPAPIKGQLRPHLAWTGSEVVVTSDDPVPTVVAWNPQTDTWRTVGTLPAGFAQVDGAHWTGEAVVLWGGDDRQRPGALLDPGTGELDFLPALPSDAPDPVGSVSVLLGDSLFVAGVERTPSRNELVSASLPLGGGQWQVHVRTAAPGLPFNDATRPAAAVMGDRVLLWGNWWQRAAVFHQPTRTWSLEPGPKVERRSEFAWAADGERLYVWGGEAPSFGGGTVGRALDDGIIAAIP